MYHWSEQRIQLGSNTMDNKNQTLIRQVLGLKKEKTFSLGPKVFLLLLLLGECGKGKHSIIAPSHTFYTTH